MAQQYKISRCSKLSGIPDWNNIVWKTIMKGFHEFTNRYYRAPWDIGSREELMMLVESGRINPGRAIDLGCGAGANANYLTHKGFDVTSVDFAEAAIENAWGMMLAKFNSVLLIVAVLSLAIALFV